MPSEGVELSPNGHILTDEEVVRLATLFVRNGVTKIRLTGGEPTVRKGLIQIVGKPPTLARHPAHAVHPKCFGESRHRSAERAAPVRAAVHWYHDKRHRAAPQVARAGREWSHALEPEVAYFESITKPILTIAAS